MSRIRSEDTKPELVVRSMLHRLGFRFRVHSKHLPGKPDIVLPKYRTVIFVHGCFWHQHTDCKICHKPKSNIEYWHPKLARNISRFVLQSQSLNELGWAVGVVWECETKEPKRLENLLIRLLRAQPSTKLASKGDKPPSIQEKR